MLESLRMPGNALARFSTFPSTFVARSLGLLAQRATCSTRIGVIWPMAGAI